MKKNENFDCVEFQRAVRLKNYEECNGDYSLMIEKQNKRLKNNDLWLRLIKRKAQNKAKDI